MSADGPYRPSNGTEGEMFYSAFCAHCTKEREHRTTGEGGCDIYLRTMAFGLGDAEYLTEWVLDIDGTGKCTAWEEDFGQEWSNPIAVAEKQAAYEALPRDLTTGRPIT